MKNVETWRLFLQFYFSAIEAANNAVREVNLTQRENVRVGSKNENKCAIPVEGSFMNHMK